MTIISTLTSGSPINSPLSQPVIKQAVKHKHNENLHPLDPIHSIESQQFYLAGKSHPTYLSLSLLFIYIIFSILVTVTLSLELDVYDILHAADNSTVEFVDCGRAMKDALMQINDGLSGNYFVLKNTDINPVLLDEVQRTAQEFFQASSDDKKRRVGEIGKVREDGAGESEGDGSTNKHSGKLVSYEEIGIDKKTKRYVPKKPVPKKVKNASESIDADLPDTGEIIDIVSNATGASVFESLSVVVHHGVVSDACFFLYMSFSVVCIV